MKISTNIKLSHYIIIIILLLILIFLLKKKDNFNSNIFFLKPKNWNKLLFTDKLKIYGDNLPSKYSLFVDKINVKDYIRKLNIKDLNIVKTIKILDKNNNKLNLSELPKNCVIKSNNSWNKIIIIKDRKINIMKPNIRYEEWIKEAIKPHFREHEKHYINIPPIIFVEKYLGDNISDYKFFCFYGKVKMMSIDLGRYKNHCRNIYDKNYNLLPFTKGLINCSRKISKPSNFEKMIRISEELSKPFEFVRIDLYDVNNKIYFGEFTFVPGNGGSDIHPHKYDKIIGTYWT
jgi:hypothetical protein